VELDDGSWETGFVCADEGAVAAPDISEFGGWRAYLQAREFAS
jgi:allophanate hydrolase